MRGNRAHCMLRHTLKEKRLVVWLEREEAIRTSMVLAVMDMWLSSVLHFCSKSKSFTTWDDFRSLWSLFVPRLVMNTSNRAWRLWTRYICEPEGYFAEVLEWGPIQMSGSGLHKFVQYFSNDTKQLRKSWSWKPWKFLRSLCLRDIDFWTLPDLRAKVFMQRITSIWMPIWTDL